MKPITAILAAIVFSIQSPSEIKPVEEDSPLWNCYTMGNEICGQYITGGFKS